MPAGMMESIFVAHHENNRSETKVVGFQIISQRTDIYVTVLLNRLL